MLHGMELIHEWCNRYNNILGTGSHHTARQVDLISQLLCFYTSAC